MKLAGTHSLSALNNHEVIDSSIIVKYDDNDIVNVEAVSDSSCSIPFYTQLCILIELGRIFIFGSMFCMPKNQSLSHNNTCFLGNIAITNFLVSHTCKIRFHDVIDRTVHVYVYIMMS